MSNDTKSEEKCKYCDGKGEYLRFHKTYQVDTNTWKFATMTKCPYCLGTGSAMPLSKVGF